MTVPTPASPLLLDDGTATFSATGYGHAAGVAAIVNLGALSAWNGAAVLNVASVKTSAGNETYLLNIQGATASSFASPQTLGSVQVSVAGQYLIPVTAFFGGVFYPYLRLQLVLSGTAPSIKMAPVSGTTGGCFALPFSGFSTASTADLTTLFGIAAQNVQQLSASLVAWANGTATGGPNGNGDYPIYDASGSSTLAPSFAAYAATVKQGATGPAGPAGPTGPAGTTSYTGLANIPPALTLDANGRLEGTNIAVTPGGATLASLVPAQAGADVTGQHIAAGVIGQGPFATGTAYSLLTGIPNALLLNAAELLEASSMAYGPGVLVSALQPAQANADQTSLNTAAGFTGQGALATLSSLGFYGGQITGMPAALASANLVGGAYISASYLYNPALGQSFQTYWPATTSADKTANATAAGFAGQSAWATYSAFSPSAALSTTANLVYNGGFRLNTSSGWTTGLGSLYWSEVGGLNGAPFAYAQANVSFSQSFSRWIPSAAGLTYMLQGWLYSYGITSGYVRLYITAYNSSDAYISNPCVLTLAAGSSWTEVSGQFTVPAGTAYITVSGDTCNTAQNANTATFNASNSTVAWGLIKIAYGTSVTPFSDEATTGAMYAGGLAIESVQPAQASADKTSSNTAAAIAGQGPYATATASLARIQYISDTGQMVNGQGLPYNMQQGSGFVFGSNTPTLTTNVSNQLVSNAMTLYLTNSFGVAVPSITVAVPLGNTYAVFLIQSNNTLTAISSGTSGYYTAPNGYVSLGIMSFSSSGAASSSNTGNQRGGGNICIP